MSINAILLAGGSSSRFKSPIPKVLYPLLDKPIIEHLIDSLKSIGVDKIIIVSGKRTHQELQKYAAHNIKISEQKEPLGTFDAVVTALDQVESQQMLIINADTPLVRPEFIKQLIEEQSDNVIATMQTPTPFGLGRVIRDKFDKLQQIIEQKELNESQQDINEVNAGVYKLHTQSFKEAIKHQFETQEQYLTSYLGSYEDFSLKCSCICEQPQYTWSLSGINSFEDFESLENAYYQSRRKELVEQGAILKNSSQIFITGNTTVQQGATLTGPCVLKGNNFIGSQATIAPFSLIEDSMIQEHTNIYAFTSLSETKTGSKNQLGPFLRTRGNVQTGPEVHLGNFLEVKNSLIGAKTKIKHFGYIGDGTVGQQCNIGAGCVFCNYDGKKKQRTVIKNNVFVGASSQFVAPLTIEENCYIGANTLVTQSLPSSSLALRRASFKVLNKKVNEVKN